MSEGSRRVGFLHVRAFSVDYGYGDEAVRAVDRVDLHLNRSTVLGVAGESGSGKSTLVYGLTRLLRAPGVITGGQALFNRGDDDQPDVIDLTKAGDKELRSVRWSEISVVLQSALNALTPSCASARSSTRSSRPTGGR